MHPGREKRTQVVSPNAVLPSSGRIPQKSCYLFELEFAQLETRTTNVYHG